MNRSRPPRDVGSFFGDIVVLDGKEGIKIVSDGNTETHTHTHTEHPPPTDLAGECIGELVRFLSLRMSCTFPPLLSHSTDWPSTRRF